MNSRLPQENTYDLEQQFLLSLPEEAARYLAEDLNVGIPLKDNLTIEMKPDMRNAIVRYNGQVYRGVLLDLPCIIESLKTTDRKTFYKTADISQIMICSQSEDNGPIRGSAAYLSSRSQGGNVSTAGGRDPREYQYLHGITPPLKNVLRRRFRKTRKKRLVDMPQIEKEVKQLLRADMQAEGVKWEVIWSDPPRTMTESSTSHKTQAAEDADGDSSAGPGKLHLQDGARLNAVEEDEEEEEEGHGHYAVDHLAVFGEISSSSSGNSSSSCPSTSCSDDEDATKTSKSAAGRHQRKTGGASGAAPTDAGLGDFVSRPSPETPTSDAPAEGDTLKDELAAQLLLSDSGDEDDNNAAGESNDNRGGGGGSSSSSECDPLIGRAPADRRQRPDSPTGVEDTHAAAEIVLDDVDVGLGDGDEDDEFQRGGELLDDPFGPALSHSEDDELSRDNF
ncbi:transcription initiation factor TFIID subunit 7 [Sparganum proliferum]